MSHSLPIKGPPQMDLEKPHPVPPVSGASLFISLPTQRRLASRVNFVSAAGACHHTLTTRATPEEDWWQQRKIDLLALAAVRYIS